MSPLRYLRALFSAVFPPHRRVVGLVRPYWHTADFLLLECGHRVQTGGDESFLPRQTRCDRCVR